MTTREQMRSLWIALVVLFALAAGMGVLVTRGLMRGQTILPMKQSFLQRPVFRAEEPAMYWTSITIYGVVGAGALVLGVLGVRASRRLR